MVGSAILLLWGAGVVSIGHADCGRGAWGSVSFIYHGGTGCTHMRRCDLHGRLVVSHLRCGGEVRGMKSLCTGSGLKSGVHSYH